MICTTLPYLARNLSIWFFVEMNRRGFDAEHECCCGLIKRQRGQTKVLKFGCLHVDRLLSTMLALPFDQCYDQSEIRMSTVSLAQAKAHLSRLLDQVEAGEEIIVTRHGQPVARISPVENPKQPIKSLAEFRSRMPHWRKSSVELLSEMRDEGL